MLCFQRNSLNWHMSVHVIIPLTATDQHFERVLVKQITMFALDRRYVHWHSYCIYIKTAWLARFILSFITSHRYSLQPNCYQFRDEKISLRWRAAVTLFREFTTEFLIRSIILQMQVLMSYRCTERQQLQILVTCFSYWPLHRYTAVMNGSVRVTMTQNDN